MKREEAIEELVSGVKRARHVDSEYADSVKIEALNMAIEELSKEPARPRGKWITGARAYEFICSECGRIIKDMPTSMYVPLFKFCPYCRAEIESEGKK